MKSSTRLDSIFFQLTPTRTRCDLVITANGKTEKIASGLLNPFLAHLRAAQEQICKGGYSIVLEPNRGSDAAWFTKGTVERFVRFVSTPEILERVYTIESEMLQIEKAISLQNNLDSGPHVQVEDLPVKSGESLVGSKPTTGGNEEKAIVLYQPADHQLEEDGSNVQEKNSKVQLVQVLETRKTVLQKEQGMAFARAAAASFDIDNIAALIAFAECFGASRMMDACKKFVDLWKAKHDSGQWVEVEASESMSCRLELPSTNAAGIVFLNPNEQRDFKESGPHGEIGSEKNGTPFASSTDHRVQPNPQEYIPSQFSHPMMPPWQMHPQASGMPVFPPYPMQGLPYFQNYPGNSPFFQPPYPSLDESRLHAGQRTRQRRHSMDSRDMSTESETQEMDTSGRILQDDVHTDEEDSVSRKPRNKCGKASRKQSGTVVIRNINYIASAKQESSDCDSQFCSDSGTDDLGGNMKVNVTRKLKKKGVYGKSGDSLEASSKEVRMSGQAGDDGHWQAFQNFLLRDADENNDSAKSSMFSMEGKVQGRKRQTAIRDDSAGLGRNSTGENQDLGFSEHLDIAGDATCMKKPMDDQMLGYGREANSRHSISFTDSRSDQQFMEAGGRRGTYRRSADTSMQCMINQQEKLTDVWDSSLDPVITNGFRGSSNNNNRGSAHNMADDSFMVLQRPGSLDQVAADGRTAMDMDNELPSVLRKTEDHTVGTRRQSNYEPNDLNLMPNRVTEDGPSGYDPAMDYEMQAQVKKAVKLSGNRKETTKDDKEGPRKAFKDQKSKAEKRMTGGTKREKPFKLSPSEDARARAERLRAFKADLQKLKKEKEEEQLKRLEALKIERQKRIAARSGAKPVQSPMPSQQVNQKLPKLSPVSQKGSKFSDTEPGSSSPLQRSTLKTVSKVHADSSKVSRRLNNGSPTNGNRLIRSASSLSMRKEENNGLTPESKATITRIRRFSEPKGGVNHFSGKTRSTEPISKHRVTERPEIKKTSATANVDKAKSVLPEQKLRASKGSSVSNQKKSTTKEMSQKMNDKMFSNASANTKMSDSPTISRDGDDNTVVEKTVVMLEYEKPSASVFRVSEDKTSVPNMQSDAYNQVNQRAKPEEDTAIPHQASPITVKEVDREASNFVVKGQSHVRLNEAEKVSPNLPNNGTTEKPYQAPYARVSSLEDPCMAESNYGKAPPTSSGMEATGLQTTKVHVSDSQRQGLVKILETDSGKHRSKESSKGFKRLLKFGKKKSAASEPTQSDEPRLDGSVGDVNALHGSSSEVFTLKNLLTQEESSSAGTPPKKSSRSFSLLSAFRSKNSEKKLTT